MLKDYVGFGALGEALVMLGKSGYKRVFVVASESGWNRFNQNGKQEFFPDRECAFFSAFSPNPDFSEIQAGRVVYDAFKPDLIVAIGGGSPIDVAKVIKALAHTKEPFDPEKPATIKPSGEGPPLVAISTTAGSGSEATKYAVFYVGMRKQSISSVRPDMAVVDPELSYAMPPRLTAETGFDALSQAVESYWGSLATPESREISTRAINCALPNLYNAVHNPAPDNRYNMANAAYLSGEAINTTRTTIPHSLAYFLTKRYGIAHGHAVALTVPSCILLNSAPDAKVTTPAGPDGHKKIMADLIALLGQKTPEDAVIFWRNLMAHCGLESTLAEAGLTSNEQLEELIATIDPTRLGNHPVAVDRDLLMRYLKL